MTTRTGLGTLTVPPAYRELLHKDGHDNVEAFLHSSGQLFRGTPLAGKQVLEIGSGRGLMAVLMGLQGAARVISMEPELVGATSGVIAEQKRRVEALGLANVFVESADFNTWDAQGQRFDVILSRASLNHLYPSDQHALEDRATYEGYLTVARRIHDLLLPGGVFIATDACRYAFFTMARRFGIRRPWRWKATGVDWRHHQNPGTWSAIFKEAGFDETSVRYPVPFRLRQIAPLVNTAPANFFLRGSFILRATRERRP